MIKNKEKYTQVRQEFPDMQLGIKAYKRGLCLIIVSPPLENNGWRVSISCQSKDPSWKEIKEAWYDLVPDSDIRVGAMFFPPINEYVNLHKHCFHIHEVPKYIKNFLEIKK